MLMFVCLCRMRAALLLLLLLVTLTVCAAGGKNKKGEICSSFSFSCHVESSQVCF